ncbi:MAG: nuclear transport factor 2 family protein [Acidobacteriota bacterium]|nr:nuclear transport factor 2 family protein [Acidobacteriota bacterium]
MSKTIVAVLGLFLTLSPCYAQNQGNKSELAIKKLERELEAALLKGDSVELERILADDYIEINAQGGVKKKSDVIAVARAMGATSRGVTLGPDKTVDDLTIRLHGDNALVVGRTTIRYQFMKYQTSSSQRPSQNPVTVDQERFLRAYSKVAGRWQLVAWQTTSIAKH